MKLKMNIKENRLKVGLTQKQLADILGITQASMSEFESGKTPPSLIRTAQIAKALNMKIDQLIEYQDIQDNISTEYDKIVKGGGLK